MIVIPMRRALTRSRYGHASATLAIPAVGRHVRFVLVIAVVVAHKYDDYCLCEINVNEINVI